MLSLASLSEVDDTAITGAVEQSAGLGRESRPKSSVICTTTTTTRRTLLRDRVDLIAVVGPTGTSALLWLGLLLFQANGHHRMGISPAHAALSEGSPLPSTLHCCMYTRSSEFIYKHRRLKKSLETVNHPRITVPLRITEPLSHLEYRG